MGWFTFSCFSLLYASSSPVYFIQELVRDLFITQMCEIVGNPLKPCQEMGPSKLFYCIFNQVRYEPFCSTT